MDLLFIDQAAVLTLVEVKKAENADVRRKVVGQMLDYAANAPAEWDAGKLAGWLAERCSSAATTVEQELASLEHDFSSDDALWAHAVENLRAGNVRLVFVADEVPESLQALIEFLNERMTPTTVLGIEVRQYQTKDGEELMSSSLLGQTEKARVVKGTSTVRPSVIPALVQAGELHLGDVLWLLPDVLPPGARPAKDDPRLKFKLTEVTGSSAKLAYPADAPNLEEVQASFGRDVVLQALNPEYPQRRARAVHDAYAKEPGGKALGALAEERGAWDA